ncbi:unnamed protein product [Gongylonema pulchrum]|uniref:Uncharacterized protein n=1 Tax=Gongylonema pulchrum TaxID=637853 RepID=A0A183DI55_9BILA|nr:unnamed protein product [Gongylonema pulchrum]
MKTTNVRERIAVASFLNAKELRISNIRILEEAEQKEKEERKGKSSRRSSAFCCLDVMNGTHTGKSAAPE